ncbi:MAG: hypothetical protein Q9190_006846 [Brigantiaea leucoxantha]
MSGWEQYRKSRTSWGINVLGSFCVEIEASDGTKGFATGFGGPPACWLVKQHFERFLIGAGIDERPLRTDVPSIAVLRKKRPARCSHIRRGPRPVGPQRQTVE